MELENHILMSDVDNNYISNINTFCKKLSILYIYKNIIKLNLKIIN